MAQSIIGEMSAEAAKVWESGLTPVGLIVSPLTYKMLGMYIDELSGAFYRQRTQGIPAPESVTVLDMKVIQRGDFDLNPGEVLVIVKTKKEEGGEG